MLSLHDILVPVGTSLQPLYSINLSIKRSREKCARHRISISSRVSRFSFCSNKSSVKCRNIDTTQRRCFVGQHTTTKLAYCARIMSNVYVSEPPTTGHVIITTNTYGSIDIHLYCKECPTITKYFLHLCTHEYYNNVIFHRILSNLLIQTGLVRYTGGDKNNNNNTVSSKIQPPHRMKEYNAAIHANESYERRQYELHSRIRFNHRGQVAMALPIDQHTNNSNNTDDDIQELQPQFFITTDEAPYLNGKHVIFGTVVGPTIFNVIRINQYGGGGGGGENEDKSHTTIIDTNDSSAPRIISTKVVTNPFEQTMIPKSQISIPWLQSSTDNEATSSNLTHNKKKKKRNGKLDTNVLSFGDDVENDTSATAVVAIKRKQHSDLTTTPQPEEEKIVAATTMTAGTTLGIATLVGRNETQQQVQHQQLDDIPVASHGQDDILPSLTESQSEPNGDIEPVSKPISAVEAHRAKYLSKKQKRDVANSMSPKQQRDDETFRKLLTFRRKIHDITVQSKNDTETTGVGIQKQQPDNSLASRMARRAQEQMDAERNDPHNSTPSYHGQILNDDDNDDDPNRWMQTKFVCKKHMDHLSGDNKDATEEYEVIDSKQKERNRKRR